MEVNDPGQSLSARDVLAFARHYADAGLTVPVGFCQKFVRSAFGSGGGAPTAVAAWQATSVKHTSGEPKVGSAVYWGGGAGHVAIYAGNGMVYSTDAPSAGKVGLVDMDYITKKWGKPYLGWSPQSNEKTITTWDAKPVAAEKGGGRMDFGGTTVAGGDVQTELSPKELRQRYGYAAKFYDQSPELQKLLAAAVKAQWTPEEFAARFQNTKWYRKHTDAEREFAVLSTSRPAEAQRQVDVKRQAAQQMYRQMGVPVAGARLDDIVKQAVIHGWGDDELRDAISAEFDYQPGHTYGGMVGSSVDDFKKMAADYVVPLADKTVDQWTTNVLRGEATPDDFLTYIKAQAKSQWDDPGLQAAIDKGITVDQYLSPYRQTAAATLGLNPDAVDWQDPKWQQAVFHRDDKGARGLMSLADFNRLIRTDDRFGFDRSQNGVGQGTQLAQRLADLMGG